MHLKNLFVLPNKSALQTIPDKKLLISTINAHSYNMAQKDAAFAEVLTKSEILLPDGFSIVIATKWLTGTTIERVAGWDLFIYEMEKLNQKGGTCFFLGSKEKTLELIKQKTAVDYPNIQTVTYSPPYQREFTEEENNKIVQMINAVQPDLLWIGMTAPKQEKWSYTHLNRLNINCHIGNIGAVFDFYAETIKRAPVWCQKNGLEWIYRLIKEPRRLWKRYLIGNIVFLYYICLERYAK
jgi:N-acetylglucosaminyldiphosphoundecaprenol N-acetyl-beta-D-mannosaminyltransferase